MQKENDKKQVEMNEFRDKIESLCQDYEQEIEELYLKKKEAEER